MALPGVGFRSVLSVMFELSYHLLEPTLFTSLTAPVSGPNPATATLGSLGYPVNALYVGAEIVVDVGRNQEVVTILSVNPSNNTFTAEFLFPHSVGAQVQGATFPVQAASGDFFFSQSEILNYIARGQNEFIARIPCIFNLNTQYVQMGQIYQQLACDAVELHHVASSSLAIPLTSLSRSGGGGFGSGGFGQGGFGGGGTSAPGVVTAVTQGPHGLLPGYKFSVFNCDDPSFDGAFQVATVISTTSFTYIQYQYDGTVTGPECGMIVLWKRLYLTTQEELYIQDPFWRNQNITKLSSAFEDRTGLYRMGVNGRPAATFPLEVLVSIRDTDSLSMTDGFLLPDLLVPAIKYKAMEYAALKDSEQRNPQLAQFCSMQFERWVLATKRWMSWAGINIEATTAMASQGRGR